MKTFIFYFFALGSLTTAAQSTPNVAPTAPAHIIVTEEPIMSTRDIDQKAIYEGGVDKLAAFISENMQHPLDAKGKKQTGTVYVEFILEKDGTTSRQKIVDSSSSPELDAEAIRITKLIHFKTAAMKDGKAVRSKYVMPVEFVD